MSDNTLKQKLEARRRAMSSTLKSQTPSDVEDSQMQEEDGMVEELTHKIADAMEDEEENLKLTLQQRREKSKRILEQQEQDESQYPTFSKQAKRPPSTSSDLGQTDLSLSRPQTPSSVLGSPRTTELGSRSSTPFGKFSSDAKSRLKSTLQQRLSAKRSSSGVDSERFERSRRLRDRVTRSTRLLTLGRERDAEAQLISQVESTLKLKRAADQARQDRGEPSEEDCYDFFTKQYEDVSPEKEEPAAGPQTEQERPEPSLTSQDVLTPAEDSGMIEEVERRSGEVPTTSQEPMPPDEQAPEGTEERQKLLGDLPRELDWHLFDVTAAEYTKHSAQVKHEREVYFIPSRLPPSITSKVDENTAPRYLEDEGIFVGEKPVVHPTNINILENRLLTQPDKGQKWFGVDGKVDSLANPLKQIQTRPWLEDELVLDENLQTFYVKAHIPSTDSNYLDGSAGEIELQINIGTVVFMHHPLMSREHVLASNISQMYDEYIDMKQKNYVSFFVEKLEALRNAVSDLKDHTFPRDAGDTTTHESRVYDYICEIRRTTQQLNMAESMERDLMRRIIEEWNHIKQLREQQGYVNTTVKLTIKKEQINKEEDKKEWLREVKREVKERREEYATSVVREYEKEMEKYRTQLQAWKKNRMKIKEQRKKDAAENLLETKEVDDSEITIAGNIDKPQKPDKPSDFDEELARSEIMSALIESRRNPGEDKISLLLANTASLTPPSGIPANEAARRRAVQKSSILLKVRFNGKEVFCTDSRPLSTDFKLNFGLIFRIRIVQWPESLKVQFLDEGLVSNTMFSEVFLRVPDTRVHSGNAQLGLVNFSSDQMVPGENTAVGSNSPFTLRPGDVVPTSCNTHGQLICCVSWGLDESGEVLAPKGAVQTEDPYTVASDPKAQDFISALGAEGLQDRKSVTKWVQDTRLDPNDPDNAALMPFMEDSDGLGLYHALDFFRLEQLQEEFNFLTDEEFNQMNRFRLLQLRTEEVPEFRNVNMVPCQETEILDSFFTPYERRLKEKAAVMMEGGRFVESGTLSAHRLEVLQYRQRVRDEVMNRFFAARHYRTFEDIVHEEQVPDVTTLGLAFGKALEPRRPLKPIRKERKKATGKTLTEGSVKILVTVIRGHNLPTRQGPDPVTSGAQGLGASLRGTTTFQSTLQPAPRLQTPYKKMFSLSPFVAVSFQDNVVTSQMGNGPSPSWNEELKVPFSAPNSDYSASSLQTIDDVLFIHLFDRHIEDLPPNTDDPSLMTRKATNHWLGTFKLPFSTIYQRGSIDGTFKLKVPPVLLGYSLKEPQSSDVREFFDSQFTSFSNGSYLTLFITLDPILRPTDPVKARPQSKEDPAVMAKCGTFLADCERKFPQRNVKTTVVDLKGESVLITRYVAPLQPPAELTEDFEFASLQVSERLARFVSLIPFSSDNVTFAGVCDLWSTCEQFIHMLKGDEEEHAVLLLNYFLYLGKQAYLVLGSAIPEGNTAYVLTMETTTQEIFIWNASTGEHFSHNDNLCPLKSVGSLVNDTNIWCNIQAYDQPSKVRFDVSRTSDWKPLFTSPPPQGIPTIQPTSLYYVATDSNFVARLTHTITETLKNKIMEWRPRHVTRWNRPCTSVLLDVLKDLEGQYHRRGQDFDHTAHLLSKMGEYRITGFPMDMPFTDIDSIVTAVRSTEVHKIQDPDISFSLAVYIHPYPASVLAVWVYVAALVGRRQVLY